jgi:hypothetical protein
MGAIIGYKVSQRIGQTEAATPLVCTTLRNWANSTQKVNIAHGVSADIESATASQSFERSALMHVPNLALFTDTIESKACRRAGATTSYVPNRHCGIVDLNVYFPKWQHYS